MGMFQNTPTRGSLKCRMESRSVCLEKPPLVILTDIPVPLFLKELPNN
jgi:hypothetical protein